MLTFTRNSRISEIARTEKGKSILEKYAPQVFTYPGNAYVESFMGDVTLEEATRNRVLGLTEDCVAIIEAALIQPDEVILAGLPKRKSMDEVDRESYRAADIPFSGKLLEIQLQPGGTTYMEKAATVSLDGTWEMIEGGDEANRLQGKWDGALPAEVPGSVHLALVKNGKLPDPSFGMNQKIARLESFKTWWFKKTFARPDFSNRLLLYFGGVCNRCSVWLNGAFLGSHEGMVGGPEFDITGSVKLENELVVKLEPIPFKPTGSLSYPENNESWKDTVVFNNVYGWHYSNMQSLGIWENVELHKVAAVEIRHPFISATDHETGTARLSVELSSTGIFKGALVGEILPKNFAGEAHHFEYAVVAEKSSQVVKLEFKIPDPKLWWPVDLGEQNLYWLKLWFVQDGSVTDFKQITFGIRSVMMKPLPEGPREDQFNWTFVVNGKSQFIKGTNWCTMDSLMDFSKKRYERYISLAAKQHVQMVRAWGSGMPETDEFYDLCDEYGVMVFQEWPTAWNSHETQPYDMLEETVRLTTLRIRNHPALIIYCSGNESSEPFGRGVDLMGRLSLELDGTRPFHRGEPWGGSLHNYTCYWGRAPLDYNVAEMKAKFWGEFGIACMPPFESVSRYLPEEEKKIWPPLKNGTLTYHTPIFGHADDLARQLQYAYYFVDKKLCNVEWFTVGSQLSQAVGLRYPLERARTRWPFASGACYYKLNDNFPAASWSTVDWYGAPKIGYYFVQDAFAPLHACVLFSRLNFAGTPTDALDNDIFLMDDDESLAGKEWKVWVKAYNSELQLIKAFEFTGQGKIESPQKLGKFLLNFEETDSSPLLVVAEVQVNGALADRTFYFANFEAVKGSLFTLPKTHLTWSVQDHQVTIVNQGSLPAVAVHVEHPGHLDTFTVSDGYFWMEPGEKKVVEVNENQDLRVKAWNAVA
jgi:beta-mannosidase